MLADAGSGDVRVLTVSGNGESQIRVHSTRRVLDCLLMAWRSGYQLANLCKYLQGGDGQVVPLLIKVRKPLTRVITGSVIEADFKPDPGGYRASSIFI